MKFNEWVSLAGPAGLLIPVRDVRRLIVALKVRVDEPIGGTKYPYVSSKGYGGPGPGSPVHVPLFSGDTTTVRMTEGELRVTSPQPYPASSLSACLAFQTTDHRWPSSKNSARRWFDWQTTPMLYTNGVWL